MLKQLIYSALLECTLVSETDAAATLAEWDHFEHLL